jgi:hypothetical protein
MSDHFAVYDEHRLVIEVFLDPKTAKDFARDYRQVFHCRLPKVVGTPGDVKPGDLLDV